MIFIDCETTGLNPRKDQLHGIGHSEEEDQSQYDLYNSLLFMGIHGYQDICGHNARFDAKFLLNKGITIDGKIFDTLNLAQLIYENLPSYGLKELVKLYLGEGPLESKLNLDKVIGIAGKGGIADLCLADLTTNKGEFTAIIGNYCKEDVNNTLKLWHVLYSQLEEIHQKMRMAGFKKTLAHYYAEECVPLERVLLDMEMRGIRIDKEKLDAFKTKLESEERTKLEILDGEFDKEIREIEDSLYSGAIELRKTEAGKRRVEQSSEKYGTCFNWSSNQHIGKLIYGQLSCPQQLKKKTKSGQWDTSEAQLSEIVRNANGRLKTFLENYQGYKKIQKLLTTYTGSEKGLASHIEGDRIYPSFVSGGGPVTGRLACREPNLQNLPREYPEIKRCFIPDREKVFAYLDYSQIELRIAAHLSEDPVMLRGFNEGHDLHAATAKRIFGREITPEQRQTGKTINFATIYDASAYRLADLFEGKYTVEECERFRTGFFNLYSGYYRWLSNTQKRIVHDGYAVTEFGRVRRLPALKECDPYSKEYKHAIKQGVNFIIQSYAASVCKRAMIALHKEGFELVSQVHDSLLISLDKSSDLKYNCNRIQEIVEGIVKLRVPLKAEVKLLNSMDEGDIYAHGISKAD